MDVYKVLEEIKNPRETKKDSEDSQYLCKRIMAGDYQECSSLGLKIGNFVDFMDNGGVYRSIQKKKIKAKK